MNKNIVSNKSVKKYGFLYRDLKDNILYIEYNGIKYIDYSNNSYSNLLTPNIKFKIIVSIVKNYLSEIQQKIKLKRFKAFFYLENSYIKIVNIQNSKKINIKDIYVKFENEGNYLFNSLDLKATDFKKIFKKNFISSYIKIIKKQNEKFINLKSIEITEKEIAKNILKITPVFIKNYTSLKMEILNEIDSSKGTISAVRTVKNINIKLAIYNFLYTRIFNSLRNKIIEKYGEKLFKSILIKEFSKPYLYNLISKNIKIKNNRILSFPAELIKARNEISDFEKNINLIISQKTNNLSPHHLTILARNYIIKNENLIKNLPREIFIDDDIKMPTFKEIEGFSINHLKDITGTLKITKNYKDIKNINSDTIIVCDWINNDPLFVKLLKKAKAVIIERGGIISQAALLSYYLNKNCIQIEKATQILKDGTKAKIEKNKLRLII